MDVTFKVLNDCGYFFIRAKLGSGLLSFDKTQLFPSRHEAESWLVSFLGPMQHDTETDEFHPISDSTLDDHDATSENVPCAGEGLQKYVVELETCDINDDDFLSFLKKENITYKMVRPSGRTLGEGDIIRYFADRLFPLVHLILKCFAPDDANEDIAREEIDSIQIMDSAPELLFRDPYLWKWLQNLPSKGVGHFLSAIASAAAHADGPNQHLMYPLLRKLQEKYPQYNG